jgi:hypothetical protein
MNDTMKGGNLTAFHRFKTAAFGYLYAAATTSFVMAAAAVLPRADLSERLGGIFSQIGFLIVVGIALLIVMLPTALPGFLVTLAFKRRYGWNKWYAFAIAGIFDVLLAISLSVIFVVLFLEDEFRTPDAPVYAILYSTLGFGLCGFTSGLAYWFLAVRPWRGLQNEFHAAKVAFFRKLACAVLAMRRLRS